MIVAITGASGHIGNCLVRELINQGVEVKALVHSFANDLENLGAQIIKGNLLDVESLNELCENVDVVFHLAAQITIDNKNADLTYTTNVSGTQNMLTAAKKAKVKRFIHFSSIHAHQVHPLNKVLDETRPLVESDKILYEYTKAQSEKLVLKAVKEGLDAIILSPTAVIGPYDYRKSFLGQAIQMIYKNSLPMLINGGYNWVDVRDIANAAITTIEKGQKGEKYILSGHFYTLKELSVMVSKVTGKKTPKFIAPIVLAHLACPFLSVYAKLTKTDPLYTHQSLDILANSPKKISYNKAQKDLEYTPRSLEETLLDTINWYKQHESN